MLDAIVRRATPHLSRLTRFREGIARRLGLRRSPLGRSPLEPKVGAFGKLAGWVRSRRIQRRALRELELDRLQRLIIFFIPGIQRVTGGVLQIYTLHRLSREFFRDSRIDAVICWFPRTGWHFHKSEGFDNEVIVFPLSMVLDAIRPDCQLLFHVPEYALRSFGDTIGWKRLAMLRETRQLQVNILNQNMQRAPAVDVIQKFRSAVQDTTCTIAASPERIAKERTRLDIPHHRISTWYYPDDAPWQPYESKRDLMIISPDASPYRDMVISAIRAAAPKLELAVIERMKYEQYLNLERAAKWSLTFGEGLDGYFYGPVFRGGVSFAVRNETFDVEGFEELRTVYADYEMLARRIGEDILALDHKEAYEAYNRTLRAPLLRVMGRTHTSDALAAFYRKEWSHP